MPEKLTNIDYERIPPQAVEIEEAVLGALMVERDALYEVINLLKSEHFYKESHRLIYEAIIQLFSENKGIDILTITERLRKNKQLEEVGGPLYITQLCGKTSTAINIEDYARIIYQKFIQRELIRIGSDLIKSSHDDSVDPADTMDDITIQFIRFSENASGEPAHISEAVKEELISLEKKFKGEKTEGFKTSLTDLDKILGYLEPTLIIIAARPSMGKTSMGVQLANNLSLKQGIPGGFFSLEMTKNMLTRWMASQITGIENSNIKTGKLMENEFAGVNEAYYKILKAPLYIDDGSGYNILSLRSKAIKLKHRHHIKYIIVDYLQLISGIEKKGKVTNRENEISEISRGLKGISKEIGIPVIALCQLNRKLMERRDKVPVLSDLRESGAIEQDADIVIFIHRPEKYGIDEIVGESGSINSKNVAQLLIAKHRDGATGTVLTRFFEQSVSFKNYINEQQEIEFSDYKTKQFKENPF
jgi:replicative DNA helicase